ncbi:MAG: hypothetical protein LIV29_01290 [Denitrobacterium sp.]|jgi:hypothetical protein|nr:hypothetical protein [Denitrobacterium sp.]
MARDFFSSLLADERLLREHGLESWPDGRDLALYLFDLEEKMDATARACGLVAEKDVRGDWHVSRTGR